MPLFRTLAVLFALGCSALAFATHNRAGEIIVCRVGDSGNWYEITIITHTKLSAPADRPELAINYGDSPIWDTIPRTNVQDDTARDLRRSEYVVLHEYAGPGQYILRMDDPNRNGGVVNIPNSIAQSFSVSTRLTISPTTGGNCSVRFLNPPIQDACQGEPWIHNPAAVDPDGDSLSFEPTVCLGLFGDPIDGYEFPGPNYSVDPQTGTIIWDAPGVSGEYNIAFIVREWRLTNGNYVEVGYVTRDMQITVVPCNNQAPVISQEADTCVEAGTFLTFNVQASDPNSGQQVTLTALGQPFVLGQSPASFLSPAPAQSVNGVFNWNTVCGHVRLQPYQVVFNATDDGQPIALQDYRTLNITIVGPAPENPTALPSGNSIELNWDQSACTNASGYLIYRRSGLFGFDPDHCETGVPDYTGYSLIAQTNGVGSTSYVDSDGLVIGNQYCYMVVAIFPDGAQGYASEEFCAILDRQVPVITKVSVGITDLSSGVDTVEWSNAYDLDTNARPGPYQFKLYRGTGLTSAGQLIWTSALHPFLAHPDTTFLDAGIDTRTAAHVYRVELFGAGGSEFIGSSSLASSVFISAAPNDEQLTISWALNTPWMNTTYDVYRQNGAVWDLIGTSSTSSYTDTALVNGQEYCYHVVSTGAYGDASIVAPLLNWSQEVCGVPVDRTPPCAPTVVIENDCELPLNTLTWNNPNNSCADDTYQYNVYFADSLDGAYVLIATITGAEDTVFTHANGSSVAGCYQVTALDTLGNESAFVEAVCGDNCPEYSLPNVFTPNGDRSNDLFGPFPYRGVEQIDLQVFNRWGQVVFETKDPDINWKGTYKETSEPLPDGVYYYLCTVTFIRLAGSEPVQLNGYVQLIGGSGQGKVN
ncbi:MAG TPA: gliding motility-associated C-terminal domain-containing protein [Flavobacteriales bacterium]|nr:gliding motility-associated C-terminal domain-containing protein [Flavobacteriales bacterium]